VSKKLESEVWDLDRCAGCGACVATCSKRIVRFEDIEHPKKKKVIKTIGQTSKPLDVCHFCDMEGFNLCDLSCPRIKKEWPDGPVLKTTLIRTKGKVPSEEPNEIIAYLLSSAMQAGMIDGVIVTDVDPWTLVPYPKVATSISEVIEAAGNQYIWSPTLEGLKDAIYKKGLKRLAVVGTPCVIQALQKMSEEDRNALNYIMSKIKVRVGLFCSGIYRVDALKDISGAVGVPITNLQTISVNQKGDKLKVTTYDGKSKEMKLSDTTKLIRKGCGRCYDLTSEFSDISIGPIGAKKGYATAIIRTGAGQNVLDNAVRYATLETKDGVDMKALKGAKDSKARRKQAEMMDDLKILMLEALRNPAKVEEAKAKFGEVYYKGTGGKEDKEKPKGRSSCGTCSLC